MKIEAQTKVTWQRSTITSGKQGSEWKASLKSQVFNCFLNVNREVAIWSSSENWFHKDGAIAKKALAFVEDFWASLTVASSKSLVWDDLVGQIDDIGEMSSIWPTRSAPIRNMAQTIVEFFFYIQLPPLSCQY